MYANQFKILHETADMERPTTATRTGSQPNHKEPLITLKLGSRKGKNSVTSICFIRGPQCSVPQDVDERSRRLSTNDTSDNEDDSNSSDDEELSRSFRCSQMLLGPQKKLQTRDSNRDDATSTAAALYLAGTLLASCHASGDALIWDLASRRVVSEFGRKPDG